MPREGAHEAAAPIGELDHLEHLDHPPSDLRARNAVKLRVEPQVLLRRQIIVERRVLEHQPDPAAHAQRVAECSRR